MANADENMNPHKSWSQAVERVSKTGYADGASNGQEAAFQSSFDLGFQQGIDFGFKLGFQQAYNSSVQQSHSHGVQLLDRRMINCQICLNGTTTIQNIGNLYNLQQEKNSELIKDCR
ncbi:hypothetical protein K1T71_010746 [Dendrolimus kikuchii]|uniref:Uncharacterized protein n=1 Tax=Dendrolimus kikuchii TaxID=765133 RepID=A0ACC1CQ09_9NEOP|nr:hypothetical protein K1T71_010746 [Dendrolimus kikuchii]